MDVARRYTGQQVNTTAIRDFTDALRHPNMSFNINPFPNNESDDNAFIKCIDDKSAQAYCPQRWKAMQAWINNVVKVSRAEMHMRNSHNLAKFKHRRSGSDLFLIITYSLTQLLYHNILTDLVFPTMISTLFLCNLYKLNRTL